MPSFLQLQNAVIDQMRLDAAADRPRVKSWLNSYYLLVSSQTGYHRTRGVATLTSGQASYVLPSVVHTILSMAIRRSGQTDNEPPLRMVSLEEILSFRRGSPPLKATPTHYAFLPKNILELWPTPSAADTLIVYFDKLPTAMSQDNDTPDLPAPYDDLLLVSGACAEAATFLRLNPTPYRQMFEFWLARFRAYIRDRSGFRTITLRFAPERVTSLAIRPGLTEM